MISNNIDMEATITLYFNDTYQFTGTAQLLEIRSLEDGRQALILDQTFFYPQGGGQKGGQCMYPPPGIPSLPVVY